MPLIFVGTNCSPTEDPYNQKFALMLLFSCLNNSPTALHRIIRCPGRLGRGLPIRNPDIELQDQANIAAADTSQILPPLARQQ